MKEISLSILFVLMLGGISFGQKFAFVDTDYVLSRIPTFKAAQEQLDKISTQYETELQEKFKEIEQLTKDYQVEKILLTDEMRKKREKEIGTLEQSAKELQAKYFGRDGMLFKKREELVKPIQDQVFNAVKEVANEGGYAVIFDSAGSANMLYTNPRYDKSDDVIKKLGYN
ncbi:MAG: OmpH family outer membrane protein [Bacteroidales bacterium]|jgi:outer membrane protein|nr:OmpH family outer membrane protein [Bacteroidales bacterium]MDD4673330.1 OmpH family outer membrane protein [Bacteroidales bacterium]MDY0349298.1 OmpH family outer membrane protein [Tenuifilaceae bacterium]